MKRPVQLRWLFIGSGSLGALSAVAMILLVGNDSWNHSRVRGILWIIWYQLLRATDPLLGLFFTHERLAPNATQLYLFNCLFVFFCGIVLGLICTTGAVAFRFIRQSFIAKIG